MQAKTCHVPPGNNASNKPRATRDTFAVNCYPNTRLELVAPGSQGRLPFVTNDSRRRSSSAIRSAT